MTKEMRIMARMGHPCGGDFLAKPFLAAHPEYAWQEPYLRDMKAGSVDGIPGPWPNAQRVRQILKKCGRR